MYTTQFLLTTLRTENRNLCTNFGHGKRGDYSISFLSLFSTYSISSVLSEGRPRHRPDLPDHPLISASRVSRTSSGSVLTRPPSQVKPRKGHLKGGETGSDDDEILGIGKEIRWVSSLVLKKMVGDRTRTLSYISLRTNRALEESRVSHQF